jgi:tRNA pseudouridine(38-40) synthase
MTTVVFKLIVSYNGFRFNGFQRQHQSSLASSAAAADEDQLSKEESSNSSITNTSHKNNSSAAPSVGVVVRAPKRPHYESKTGRPKGVPLTIQECLEQVLLDYINTGSMCSSSRSWSLSDLQLRFAGRTDKGVHAMGQVVTVHFPEKMIAIAAAPSGNSNMLLKKTKTTGSAAQPLATAVATLERTTCDIAPWEIQKAVNSRLPVDISIEHVECLGRKSFPDDDTRPLIFDPRRDATCKQYSYTLKYLRKHDLQQEQEKLLLGGGIHIFRNALDPACMWCVIVS